jgi:excisionase family DNA binding protein
MNEAIQTALLDIKRAAEYLGLKPQRIRYEVFKGRMPHVKLGRSVRFTVQQLETWIQKNSKKGGE